MTRPLGGRALFAFVSPLYAEADAQVMVKYCVQCHNLPSPAMHHAAKRPVVLDRMVMRIQGGGNMGALMRDMMAGLASPLGRGNAPARRPPRAQRKKD